MKTEKLTSENLKPALRMFGFKFEDKAIDALIDIFQLVKKKGSRVTVKDVTELQEKIGNIKYIG